MNTNFDSTAGSAGQVRFFNPGPVWVRPQVIQAMTGPMMSHRSQAFMDLYGRIQEKLPKVFRTKGAVHTLATSATGVWESVLVSCVEGPVLACSNGSFSDKWGEMGKRLGLKSLSMGMSGDFEIAIAEGATHVRIGTAIFGERA